MNETALYGVLQVFWVHSGGTNPSTGGLSEASERRMERMIGWFKNLATRNALVKYGFVVSGEQTRKSGKWPQSEKLAASAVEYAPSLADNLHAFPVGTNEAYLVLVKTFPDADMVYYAVDDVHKRRYYWQWRLLDRAYSRRMYPIIVKTDAVYDKAYHPNYVLCYNALAWSDLAVKYLRKGRIGTLWVGSNAVVYLLLALARVGLKQFKLFASDRMLNKDTDDPAKLARIAEIRRAIRPELLGE